MEIAYITIDKSTAAKMVKAGWEFDWSISTGASALKLGYFTGDKLQGVVEFERVPKSRFNYIHLIETAPWNRGREKEINDVVGVLFATVAEDSIEAGFDGFVSFQSKTVLKEHYIRKYGAKLLFNDQLYFDTEASKKLIKEYLGGRYA